MNGLAEVGYNLEINFMWITDNKNLSYNVAVENLGEK